MLLRFCALHIPRQSISAILFLKNTVVGTSQSSIPTKYKTSILVPMIEDLPGYAKRERIISHMSNDKDNVKRFKQYFTPDTLAEYMVRLIPNTNIQSVVDLSMGECGLLEKAKKRWHDADYYGADIDELLLKKIKNKCPYIHTYFGDALSIDTAKWDEYRKVIERGGFDLVLANPPFDFYNKIKTKIGKNYLSVPIEIRFLLNYLKIVRCGGYVCIILPYGVLSARRYIELRRELLKETRIRKIICLYNGCFDGIDANTCILLLQKKERKGKTQNDIRVEKINYLLKTEKEYMLRLSNSYRWDLEYAGYHGSIKIKHMSQFKELKLRSIVEECHRGKSLALNPEAEAEKGRRFLHTTDIRTLYLDNKVKRYVKNRDRYFNNAILQEGDILIGRVGENCYRKIYVARKSDRSFCYSDCLIRLHCEGINPYYLGVYFASEHGQKSLKSLQKGSCSKYIDMGELLDLNILVPDLYLQREFASRLKRVISAKGRFKPETREKKISSIVDSLNVLIEMG